MSKKRVPILGLTVSIAVATFISTWLRTDSSDVTSRGFLSDVAEEVNKRLPMTVDENTEMIEAVGFEGIFIQNFQLTNHTKSDLDMSVFNKEMKPHVTNTACTTPETRDLLDHGVVLRYAYRDMNSTNIASYDVSMADCAP